MTPGQEAAAPQGARVRGGGGFSRIAAIGALVLVAIAILVLLISSGGGGNHYRLLFETGGQLVKGNQVLIGGVPVGSVDEVKLTDNGQAQVDITVNRPLHQGTTAIIRATCPTTSSMMCSCIPSMTIGGGSAAPPSSSTRSNRRTALSLVICPSKAIV